MRRNVIGFFFMMAIAIYALPARATINPEPFDDPSYIAGDPLSDTWTGADPSSTGIFTIDNVGGNNGKTVRLDVNSPNTGVSANTTQYNGWGGPGRAVAGGQLWFSADIEFGSVSGATPLTTNIWQLNYNRANNNNWIDLRGGFGTVQVRGNAGASLLAPVNLLPGWNRVVVMNDPTVNPNTTAWLNGVLIGTFNGGGQLTNLNANGLVLVDRVNLQRLGRGVEDFLVGSMHFDNIMTANEPIPLVITPEPTTLVMAGLGVIPAIMLIRRRRKNA